MSMQFILILVCINAIRVQTSFKKSCGYLEIDNAVTTLGLYGWVKMLYMEVNESLLCREFQQVGFKAYIEDDE